MSPKSPVRRRQANSENSCGSSQNSAFVELVEKLALRNGWKIGRVVEEIGISRTMLHFIKTGKHGVTKKALSKLAKAWAQAESSNARFKEARLRSNITLEQLAASSGYSVATISGVEN